MTTIVLLGVALIAAGAILALVHPASLLSAGEQMNKAARVYANYFVARNLAVAIALGVLLVLRARRMLAGLLVLTALIQLLDAGLDAATGRWALVPGLLVLTAVFLVGAVVAGWHLAGHPNATRRSATPPRLRSTAAPGYAAAGRTV